MWIRRKPGGLRCPQSALLDPQQGAQQERALPCKQACQDAAGAGSLACSEELEFSGSPDASLWQPLSRMGLAVAALHGMSAQVSCNEVAVVHHQKYPQWMRFSHAMHWDAGWCCHARPRRKGPVGHACRCRRPAAATQAYLSLPG